jgi:hypothetical protein
MKSLKPEIIDLTTPIACANLYQKNLEQAVEASKTALKMSAHQHAEIVAGIKTALKGITLPGMFILDLAAQAVAGYITVQVKLMDMALQQSSATIQAMVNFGQEGSIDTAAIQASLDRALEAQYTVLDFTAEQSHAVSASVKEQFAGTAAETVADSMQRSFDTALGMQRDILNIAVKPLKAAAVRA